jgi:hypothetical protein
MTLEGCGSLSLLYILFAIPRVGLVCHELFFILIIKRGREDDALRELFIYLVQFI